MNFQDLDVILAQKGRPCLTITVPTSKYTRERMQNADLIDKAFAKAKQLLAHNTWPKEQIELLKQRLDALQENLEYIRLQDGLAIYLSPEYFKIQLLPFTVKEKVILDTTFEVRDLIYFNQFLLPFYLLAISKKRARLFKGTGRDLQEVINNDFPKKYVEEYEYARPSIGSSFSPGLKSFERDKSVMEETRAMDFFKQADHSLNKYVKGNTPLFIAGVEEELANFGQVTHHLQNIAGNIKGSYDVDAIHPLAETAWNMIKKNVQASHKKLLLRIEDEIGRNLAVDGVRDVWRSAREGKGLMLLLEKDYHIIGYVQPSNPEHLYLSPPVGDYSIINDVANDIVKTVLEKGGGVQIVENGELTTHDHIALLLRY
jgi:hypothetical protein